MIFDVSDEAYDRFMGRYSARLAPAFADFAGVAEGQRTVDVGAGTGALAAELARRGEAAAAEPSPRFAAALRRRHPALDVREAPAEALPWPDASFDAALAQLVVSFVADAAAAVREMRRVVRRGGVVALCMWQEDGLELAGPLRAARQAAMPDGPAPRPLPYRSEGELRDLLAGADLHDLATAQLEVQSEYASFDEFWEAALAAVGPDTFWLRELEPERQAAARAAAYDALGEPDGRFVLRGRACAARGVV
ncbi:MAG: methyltransferase domain-containing protein [Thermoleophilia bacterium]|nr:methyltransferase domain-containing protein [Thermoleophilia bacterium]